MLAEPQLADRAVAKLAAMWRVLVPEPQRSDLTKGTAKRLTVIPDGPLALLPFETLVVESGDNHVISWTLGHPSITDLL